MALHKHVSCAEMRTRGEPAERTDSRPLSGTRPADRRGRPIATYVLTHIPSEKTLEFTQHPVHMPAARQGPESKTDEYTPCWGVVQLALMNTPSKPSSHAGAGSVKLPSWPAAEIIKPATGLLLNAEIQWRMHESRWCGRLEPTRAGTPKTQRCVAWLVPGPQAQPPLIGAVAVSVHRVHTRQNYSYGSVLSSPGAGGGGPVEGMFLP